MFEHFYIICLYRYFHRKKNWRVNLVSAFDQPLVKAAMHGLYTGHITHGTRFGMKYYAKNVVPDFCVSCASVPTPPPFTTTLKLKMTVSQLMFIFLCRSYAF